MEEGEFGDVGEEDEHEVCLFVECLKEFVHLCGLVGVVVEGVMVKEGWCC